VWLAASAMPERRARCWYLLGPVSASLRFTSFVFARSSAFQTRWGERERRGWSGGVAGLFKERAGFRPGPITLRRGDHGGNWLGTSNSRDYCLVISSCSCVIAVVTREILCGDCCLVSGDGAYCWLAAAAVLHRASARRHFRFRIATLLSGGI
jgi:hypothetical protein